jgi:hypothetical protein
VKIFHAHEFKSSQAHTETQLRKVYDILSSWSREELDEPGRAIRLMNVLAQNEKDSELKVKESSSDGRPGLAILDNLISTARTIRESAQEATELTRNADNPMMDTLSGLETDPGLVEG